MSYIHFVLFVNVFFALCEGFESRSLTLDDSFDVNSQVLQQAAKNIQSAGLPLAIVPLMGGVPLTIGALADGVISRVLDAVKRFVNVVKG